MCIIPALILLCFHMDIYSQSWILLSFIDLFAQIKAYQVQQQNFQRIFLQDATPTPDIVLSNRTARSTSHCVWICSNDDRCLSCIYQQGRCTALSWYLHVSSQSPYNVGIYYYGRQVIGNVALDKPVSQSSPNYGSHKTEHAVDGQALGNNGQCLSQSHTSGGDKAPWFQIDLLKSYKILQVRFLGKTNVFVLRLHNINIIAGDTPNTMYSTCGYYVGPPKIREWVEITCPPQTEGRFVKLDKMYSDRNYLLELCEVEITVMA